MRHKSVLAAGALSFIATAALAEATWVAVVKAEDGASVVYVDSSSIRITGSKRLYWQRQDYVNDPSGSEKTLQFSESNCATGQNRGLQFTIYYVDGTTSSSTSEEQWRYVTPGSLREGVHNYVCGIYSRCWAYSSIHYVYNIWGII